MATLNDRQGRYAARRMAVHVLWTNIQELTIQTLEASAISLNHLQVSWRYRPLAQVSRHAVYLRQLAMRVHRALLSLYLIVYHKAMSFVLIVELHIQEVLILVQV